MPFGDRAKRNEYNREYRRQRRLDPEYRKREKERDRATMNRSYGERRSVELAAERRRDAARSPEALARKLAYRRAWYAGLSPEKRRAMADRERARRLGTTVDEIERIRAEQGNACAICRESFPTGEERNKPNTNAEHVDHDHRSGKIRGLLCGPCNTAIGVLGDTADGLRRALAYLEKGQP